MPTLETSEKKAIKDYLRLKGAFVFHNLAGLGVYPGIPDLTAILKGQVYMIEVKAPGCKHKQSANQKRFQEDWEAAGGIYILGDIDEVMKII